MDCVFCAIAAGAIPAQVIDQDELTVAFEDLNPGAPVHLLVIPRSHSESVAEIADEPLLAALIRMAGRAARLRGVADSGYRLVLNVGPDAGQSVFHTHLHVLGGRTLGWPPG